MLVIAHRGLTEQFEDNSPDAVRAAFEAGADWVEIDVRMTADGVLLLSHDPDIAGIAIHESSVDELIDAGNGRGVFRLREVLVAASGGVNLEIKAPCPEPRRLANELKDLIDPSSEILISSFWAPILEEMREQMDAPMGLLSAEAYDPGGRSAVSTAKDLGLGTVILQDRSIEGSILDLIGDLRMVAWDVQTPERVRRLVTLGAAGVIVDDVRGALKALGRIR